MPIRKDLRPLYRTPQWFEARAIIRKQAEDRCQRCNRKNGTWIVYEKGRIVEVTEKDAAGAKARGLRVVKIQCGAAHLNGIAGDDRLSNLAWLCRGDHLRHDRGQHRDTRINRKDRARPLLAEAIA